MMKKARCKEQYCRQNAEVVKGKPQKTCRHHRYLKEKNQDLCKWAFDCLRRNAKRRGIDFSLTLDEFRNFSHETELLSFRGRTCHSYSVDRIDPNCGYSRENIQVLSVSENSRKRRQVLEYNWQNPHTALVRKLRARPDEDDEDLPF